jgi:IrrE N-terminal-like domain
MPKVRTSQNLETNKGYFSMSSSHLPEDRKDEIRLCVRKVYEEAGFDPTSQATGIVPLWNIINSLPYSIIICEVESLTYQSAAQFLSEQLGQDIALGGNPEQTLAGFLFAYESGEDSLDGCILVSKTDHVPRRRFSVGHELGHYFFHFLPKLHQRAGDSSEVIAIAEGLPHANGSDTSLDSLLGELTFLDAIGSAEAHNWDLEQMEEEANFFAAELLMPSAMCELLAIRYRRRFGVNHDVLAGRIASEFLVSVPAMKRRLQDLNILEKFAS